MKVSIVIPSFNQGNFIEETLLSIFNQTYTDYEIIIMDGGSTDSTVEILEKYDKKIDFWVSERDEGQTDALKKGFDKASGEIFCWLCSDDLLEPNSLKYVTDFFTKNPKEQVVTGNATWIDIKGKILKYNKDIPFIKWIWLYSYNYVVQPSTFWKASIYKKVGGMDVSKNLTMDSDLWIKFSQYCKINKIEKYLSRLRLYPEQKNVRLRDESNKEDIIIRKMYGVDRNSPTSKLLLTPLAYFVRILLKLFYGSYFSPQFFRNLFKFRVSSK